MGKQRDTQLTGTFGDSIFYKSGGSYLVRAKGNTGRQAKEAKLQAGILGKASAISAKLRTAFTTLLPEPKNRRLMYRLNNVLQRWLRTVPVDFPDQVNEIPLLRGFSFHEDDVLGGMFYAAMPVKRTVDGNLSLQVPALNSANPISPLPFTGEIRLKLIAVSCNLVDPAITNSTELLSVITYTGIPIEAQEIILPIQTKAGYLSVVAVSVNEQIAGIVGAMYN